MKNKSPKAKPVPPTPPIRMSEAESKEKIQQIKSGVVDKSTLAGIVMVNEMLIGFPRKLLQLSDADFRFATLKSSRFDFANLDRAKFHHLSFSGPSAFFNDCLLQGTQFQNAILNHVQFMDCTFSPTSSFQNATLVNCGFIRCSGFGRTEPFLGFVGVKFQNCLFSEINEQEFDFIELSREQTENILYEEPEEEDHPFKDDDDEVDDEEGHDDEEWDWDEFQEQQRREYQEYLEAERQRENQKNSAGTDKVWNPEAFRENPSTVPGCPSQGWKPSMDCSKRKQQMLVFHPDKNHACVDSATEKMKKLNANCP